MGCPFVVGVDQGKARMGYGWLRSLKWGECGDGKRGFVTCANKHLSTAHFLKNVHPSNPIRLSGCLRYIAFCTADIRPFWCIGVDRLDQHTVSKGSGSREQHCNILRLSSPILPVCFQKIVAPIGLYWMEVTTKSVRGFQRLANRYSTTPMVFCCFLDESAV